MKSNPWQVHIMVKQAGEYFGQIWGLQYAKNDAPFGHRWEDVCSSDSPLKPEVQAALAKLGDPKFRIIEHDPAGVWVIAIHPPMSPYIATLAEVEAYARAIANAVRLTANGQLDRRNIAKTNVKIACVQNPDEDPKTIVSFHDFADRNVELEVGESYFVQVV